MRVSVIHNIVTVKSREEPPFFKNIWQTLIGNYQNLSDAFLFLFWFVTVYKA